ncbi:MAG: hypothetical protein IJ475_02700 [Bacilli bacterium]|nr:hypothetical protein [Bacilli bacterium]
MYTEPIKLTKKKKIELIILIVVALWLVLFGINYFRYSQGKSLFVSIKVISDYEDGSVKEYISLGYVYRIYNRNSITREEFVPFWVLKESPEAKSDLPDTYKDYNVPDNKSKLDKYKGLLYYYVKGEGLVGTYKCINTNTRCEKAKTGHDVYDVINKDPLTRVDVHYNLSVIHKRFAFVDDSREQDKVYGDPGYERTIYLFDIVDNVILAKYSDIKENTYDEFYELAYGDDNKFIVKSYDNNKWGIVKVNEDGTVETILDFIYDSINYDVDTGYYTLCLEGKWSIYDLNGNKNIVSDVLNPIYDVWVNNNNSYFYKTGVDVSKEGSNFVNYSIYRIEGDSFLVNENVSEIIARKNYVIYMDRATKSLKVINYTNDLLGEFKLYFTEMEYDDLTHPAFEITKETNDAFFVKVYQGRDLPYDYDDVLIDCKYLLMEFDLR